MSAPSTPSVAPVLSWEKAIQQTKTVRPSNNKKNSPVMILAVIAMLVLAASGVWRSTHQVQPVKTVKIVVAKNDTGAGVKLGFMNLSFLDIPKEFVTADMVTSLNDADNHVTKSFLPAGEPLRTAMLYKAGQGLSQTLENDERAITLKLDEDELVDHSIAPDDLVDVLCVSSKDSQKYAKTICQSARVLMSVSKEQAMARHLGGNNNKITLAVSPIIAESIAEAAEVGKLRLVLRNRVAASHGALPGAEPKDLLPASAYAVDKEVNAKRLTSLPPASMLPPIMPPPPPMFGIPPQASDAEVAPSGPLQWMVQIFSGSKKETVGVPTE